MKLIATVVFSLMLQVESLPVEPQDDGSEIEVRQSGDQEQSGESPIDYAEIDSPLSPTVESEISEDDTAEEVSENQGAEQQNFPVGHDSARNRDWLDFFLAFVQFAVLVTAIWVLAQNSRALKSNALSVETSAAANAIAAKAFSADVRPLLWPSATFQSGLEWNDGGVRTNVIMDAKNFGRSPAMRASFSPRLIAHPLDQRTIQAFDQYCADELARPRNYVSSIVLPEGASGACSYQFGLAKNEIEEHMPEELDDLKDGYPLILSMFVGVTYSSMHEPERAFQTAYAIQIMSFANGKQTTPFYNVDLSQGDLLPMEHFLIPAKCI